MRRRPRWHRQHAKPALVVLPDLELEPQPRNVPESGALSPSGSSVLRRVLVTVDAIALSLAWFVTLVVPGLGAPTVRSTVLSATSALVCIAVGLWLVAYQRLYWARVCSVRTVEITRLTKVAGLLSVITYAGAEVAGVAITLTEVAVGGICSLLLLLIFRGGYRSWLRTRRTEGDFRRPVVLVGTNDETGEIGQLLASHPEIGFSVAGVLGDADEAARQGLGELWQGPVTDVVSAVRTAEATGAIVVASALPSALLNATIRDLLKMGVHVHLTSGLRGFDHRRLRAQPLAYEPIFYLEPATLSRYQLAAKRAIDLAVASLAVFISLPVLLLSAIAIKLDDGGPIFFSQLRVGRNGRTFRILKLRTMVVDAESQVDVLRERNERQGPLFKLATDPRVTRVGAFLRACSIDELPQLVNVLRGEMSLVGPRPALPSEVAGFDDSLLARTQVLPGMTGLWQVEARDNASFAAYRRLDLFYVENWSVTLDLVVMLATIEFEVACLVRTIFKRRGAASPC